MDAGAEKDFRLCCGTDPTSREVFDRLTRLRHLLTRNSWITSLFIIVNFELGKLYAKRGDEAQARKNFEIVMSGQYAPATRPAGANAVQVNGGSESS